MRVTDEINTVFLAIQCLFRSRSDDLSRNEDSRTASQVARTIQLDNRR